MSTNIVERGTQEIEAAQWAVMKDQAGLIVKSGLAPKSVDSPEKALVIILTGRELGIPAMVALRKISVINGNPTLQAELMLAMCLQRIRGFKHKILSEDEDHCTFWAARPTDGGGVIEYTGSFTSEDAKKAGLLSKQTWQVYRGAMLRARAISLTLRVVAPDVIMGLYTPDEMGALVNDEGEIIDVPVPESAPEPPKRTDSAAKPAKGEPAERDGYKCMVCGVLTVDHEHRGGVVTAGQVHDYWMRAVGAPVCESCGKQAKEIGAKYDAEKAIWQNDIAEAVTLDELLHPRQVSSSD